MFSLIWYYIDKVQNQSISHVSTADAGKPKQQSSPTKQASTKLPSPPKQVLPQEETKNAEVLAERRAKKRELLMQMTAPDRIEEDPVLEEQQATSRGGDSPVGKTNVPANKTALVMVTEKV
jgi:hypothetical protein